MLRSRFHRSLRPAMTVLLVLMCHQCIQSESSPAGQPAIGDQLCPQVERAVASLTGEEQATFVSDNQAFALDLYRALAVESDHAGENLFVSPLSASTALAMTAAGARGTTLDEMRQALRFTLPEATIDEGFNWLRAELAERADQALATLPEEQRADSSMDLAWVAGLFIQEGRTSKAPFVDTLRSQYGACQRELDFDGDPEGTRQLINEWVASETAQRITELLPPDTTMPVVLLVQAMSVAVPWELRFEEFMTSPAPFTTLDGSTGSVDMMHNSARVPYLANAELEAAALPLLGGQLEVVLVVPRVGHFATVEASLDGEALTGLRENLVDTDLDIGLPKFRFTSETIDLVPALESLGMSLPFEAGADFSAMAEPPPDHIVFVLHKAMVAFEEGGIEAAAATAVGMGGGSYVDHPDLTVDRPFLVGIRDRTTGALLFWGRITQPES